MNKAVAKDRETLLPPFLSYLVSHIFITSLQRHAVPLVTHGVPHITCATHELAVKPIYAKYWSDMTATPDLQMKDMTNVKTTQLTAEGAIFVAFGREWTFLALPYTKWSITRCVFRGVFAARQTVWDLGLSNIENMTPMSADGLSYIKNVLQKHPALCNRPQQSHNYLSY